MGYKMDLIAKRIAHPYINEQVVQIRRDQGVVWLPHLNSALQVVRRLKKGEFIVAVMDQNMKRSQGVFVDFFGRPASTVDSVARMAVRLGAEVIPGYGLWENGARHRIVLCEPVPMVDTGNAKADAVANTQAITDVIEQIVRGHPEQWFWIHRRWKLRPLKEAGS